MVRLVDILAGRAVMKLFRHKGKLLAKEDLRNLRHLRAIKYPGAPPGRTGGSAWTDWEPGITHRIGGKSAKSRG